ncbi:MAG: DNA translocase FtsK 4TM domain-containing protein, partial [Rhodoferax sp.]|nr:DNA translocase FtsK 4TM domain-containing protein [Rhodoferax sp.]
MTYLLRHLQQLPAQTPERVGWRRFSVELSLLAGLVLWLFWLVALASFSLSDAAWSTSGTGAPTANRLGVMGAWLADASYFLLGHSVWWCVAAAVRVWLGALARWLRDRDAPLSATPEPSQTSLWPLLRFWLGLGLLLAASATLEWTRFYSHEIQLPGHAGGVLGYLLGPLGMHWLGFTGSGLLAIAVLVLGSAMVFGFSWLQWAEHLGGWLFAQIETRREKMAVEEDLALGQQAAQAREQVLVQERQEVASSHVKPPVVESAVVDVPKSERAHKERQKPLFQEMPDTKLPQVDLLDAAQSRQETVAAETLEMTSRMIEKKLRDFGVEVVVVLAQPGPVITRYEIEPATGVKGSQIVGLAKDLARSLSLVSIRVVETIPGKTT